VTAPGTGPPPGAAARSVAGLAIRPAGRDDVATLHALIGELADYERLAHLHSGSAAMLEDALFGRQPVAEVLMAEVHGRTAGFALFFHTFSTFLARRGLWLEDLYVRPAFRAAGVGSSLLRAVAAIAVARGCGRFEWSVLDWNEPSIAFYRRMGATVLPDWRICRVTGDELARLGSDPGGV
jgi:GNAT superfamily N-acetyltransferase